MNLVPYAIPFFILLMLLELVWGWRSGQQSYRINDSVNSLSLGILSVSTQLVFIGLGGWAFTQVEQHYALWRLPMDSPWAWLFGLLVYDICYYWFHRISHERQLFWASHVVHHQSEDYNLSTALRQTSSGFLLSWVFYIPCFLLGVPAAMYVTIASAHLIYQFWIHTKFIPKLGPFEWFFVSPSNHRVHHGQNPQYIDKNHGGLLIIWDRLFGTFAEEKEPVTYGVTTVLHSWNPVWANLQIYWMMWRDFWAVKGWRQKWAVFSARTGWRPAEGEQRYPLAKVAPGPQQKFDLAPAGPAKWCLLAHLLLLIPLTAVLDQHIAHYADAYRWGYVGVLLLTVYLIGAAMERRAAVWPLEVLRWLLAGYLLWLAAAQWPSVLVWAGWAYLLLSASLMAWAFGSLGSKQAVVN